MTLRMSFIGGVFILLIFKAAGQVGGNNGEITFTFSTSEDENQCLTIGGKVTRQPCVFPFTYQDETYQGCTTVNDPDNKPWCSVATDDQGNHQTGSWGHCATDGSCPIDELEVSCTTSAGENGICSPLALCSGFFPVQQDVDACPNDDTSTNVCCPQQTNSVGINFAAPTFVSGAPNENTPENVTVDDINEILNIGLRTLIVGAPATTNTPASDDSIVDEIFGIAEEEEPTPESFHLRFNRPRKPALKVDESATILLDLTNEIKDTKGLSDDEAGFGLRAFDLSVSSIKAECPWDDGVKCDVQSKNSFDSKYRRADGSCNNLDKVNYGRSTTPFQRIIEKPAYQKGTLDAPRVSVVDFPGTSDPFPLPSARKISLKIAERVQVPNPKEDAEITALDGLHTTLVMQMGQFIDHDITHTPNHAENCCNKDGTFPDSFSTDKCYPIRVDESDPFWGSKGRTCMNLARSLKAPDLNCSLQFRQQMNQITHWLDASNIYGSNEEETKLLRSFRNGLLKITRQAGSKYGSLPTCSENFRPHGTDREEIAEACEECNECFFAGDVRVNEQLNLIVMHTLWMREHNRIAKFLGAENPKWDDETIFQETRRIVIAEYQHIIYKEWLPIILGSSYMTKFGLWPMTRGYSSNYLDTFEPSVTNEFATAAFRFGHSLIPHSFEGVKEDRNQRGGRQLGSSGTSFRMLLKDLFFQPEKVRSNPEMIDELAEGMLRQTGHKWDNKFVDDITNHLFEVNGKGGLDLIALNTQRGRDHGLPGYNAYREICSVGKASDWSDLKDYIPQKYIDKLKKTYRDIEDIDLFVGGFLEEPHLDSILGPVFKCIIGDTFARLKYGDRFFYDLGNEVRNNVVEREGVMKTVRFSPGQLQEIRQVSMARIICDNTEALAEVQPQAFRKPSSPENPSINKLRPCNSSDIPRVNLNAFKISENGEDIAPL